MKVRNPREPRAQQSVERPTENPLEVEERKAVLEHHLAIVRLTLTKERRNGALDEAVRVKRFLEERLGELSTAA